MLYPVCVHQDGNGSLGAIIPDFPNRSGFMVTAALSVVRGELR